ncbi:hypothetical protein TTHERM_00326740 (macronuclear) [Tetrahymena thermophila SB210]|uniref:Uncharacterized protein n=1 Tax=Tetrahymena thermophila (strain SB210) TaxID=312017 RepID=I7M4C0_TETTS|nr:hypothetical protein TTHERM_00326740 [Tetrahymena thermophila SB210]EAS06192.1 hypothetical protein TTHERM_00326740 [Tetrahymena thermophila SB210]|eukprot:XP_001026437.1 hypothetical protein TTHERM_00326740 [Tetrahymena thermophila SB210]
METLDQNCEVQAPQNLENHVQMEEETQKIQDASKPDQDVIQPEKDAQNCLSDQIVEKKSIHLNYDEATLLDQSQLEQIYLKEYRQLLNLIQNTQLKVFDFMPVNETFQIGQGFVVQRGIISNMGKAIQLMNGIKNDPRISQGISIIGNFQYFDGYLREYHSTGIRVIRVLENSSLNQEYQSFYPYVLIHYYKKEKYPRLAYKKEYDQNKQRKLERRLQKKIEKSIHKLSESYTENDMKAENVDSNYVEQRTQYRRKLRQKFKRADKNKQNSNKGLEDQLNMKEENNTSEQISESSTPMKSENKLQGASQNKQQSVSQDKQQQSVSDNKEQSASENKQQSVAQNSRQQVTKTRSQEMYQKVLSNQSFQNQTKFETCQKNKPSQIQQNQSYLFSNSSSPCTSLNQSLQMQNSYKKIKKEQLEQSCKKVQFMDKFSSQNQQQSQSQSQQLNNSFMNSSNLNQSQTQKERQQAEQLNSLKRKVSDLTNQLDSERYKALYFEDMYLQLRSFLVKQELNQLRANGFKYSASIEKKIQYEEQPSIKIEEEQQERIQLD